MLVLYESPAGYSLFKVLDEGKLSNPDNLHKELESPSKLLKLEAFHRFSDTTEAVAAATALVESKMDKSLKSFLKKNVSKKVSLGVSDKNLGGVIKEKLSISCVNDMPVKELIRGIRNKFSELVPGMEKENTKAMALGLSHTLSRYKLKFSPDKVDTMIVQAINLLDELDKEINTYAMRVREWYGWHFPELAKIVTDNKEYAKLVLKAGTRPNFSSTDFSDILMEPGVEENVKETCEISMGTDISDEDILNIQSLAQQVLSMSEYRAQLYDYLQNRMNAIAPNLTVMVGELVGARLIAHAGSLMNLAKAPASTVQILGAEKALFRALKTKHETPKYGLIYHASLIGQANPKNKGKISRVLAAKCALSIRVDALGDTTEPTIGLSGRAKVEARLHQLQNGGDYKLVLPKGAEKYNKADNEAAASYNDKSDATGEVEKKKKKDKKEKKEKKSKKDKKKDEMEVDDISDEKESKKRKRDEESAGDSPEKKKKKSKKEKKEKKDKKKKSK